MSYFRGHGGALTIQIEDDVDQQQMAYILEQIKGVKQVAPNDFERVRSEIYDAVAAGLRAAQERNR